MEYNVRMVCARASETFTFPFASADVIFLRGAANRNGSILAFQLADFVDGENTCPHDLKDSMTTTDGCPRPTSSSSVMKTLDTSKCLVLDCTAVCGIQLSFEKYTSYRVFICLVTYTDP